MTDFAKLLRHTSTGAVLLPAKNFKMQFPTAIKRNTVQSYIKST